jgi:serine/threonine protein kinase SCH9
LPGIISSFFGQVGRNPSSKPQAQDSLAVTTPFLDSGVQSHPPQHHREAKLSRTSSRSSGSLVMAGHDRNNADTPPKAHDEQYQKRTEEELPEAVPAKLPPTPISSASSFLQKETPSVENGLPEIDGSVNPVTQALKNFVLSPSSLKSRRHVSLPVSSISVNSVLAAHISNPSTSTHQTAPGSPTAPAVESNEKLPKSSSIRELRKLTSSAAAGSRPKNTPPLTPRALSHEEGYQEKKSPLSSATMAVDDHATSEKPREKSISLARNSEALPTDSPKGKLSVKIDEARGLKPSYDPYVVCVFEWNEYISKGPKHDAMDVDHDEGQTRKSRKDTLQALPIRRTDSDMGKPMAIPMKSRQSSNNSEMDRDQSRSNSLVTDPQWDHEATL